MAALAADEPTDRSVGKPLFNVVVSRARPRLYVDGNHGYHGNWAKLPHFSDLAGEPPIAVPKDPSRPAE